MIVNVATGSFQLEISDYQYTPFKETIYSERNMKVTEVTVILGKNNFLFHPTIHSKRELSLKEVNELLELISEKSSIETHNLYKDGTCSVTSEE